MKNKYFFTLFLLFAFTYMVNAEWVSEDCKYKWKYETCVKAQSSWFSWPRTIDDFVCISSRNNEKIMSQIILDEKFKEIDKEVDAYLSFLEKNKDYYFWEKAQENFLKAIDDIESRFSSDWIYAKKYLKYCDPTEEKSILTETIWCFWWAISVSTWKDFFLQTDCQKLVETKLSISKQVAFDLLKINKEQIKKDSSKKFMQKQRTKYDKLLEIIMINISYIERIWKKTPSLIKHPYNSN